VLVVRVDERPVEVEQGGPRAQEEAASVFSRCAAWAPSPNSSIIFSLNAGCRPASAR
jgi:hypothetical protein